MLLPVAQLTEAGFSRRFAALLYDSLLLLGILFGAAALMMAILAWWAPALADGQILARYSGFRLYLASWILGFYLWFWAHGGQTLGMRAWKIRLVTRTGADASYRQLLIRALTGLFGLANLSLLLGLPAWHDRLSNTRILFEPAART